MNGKTAKKIRRVLSKDRGRAFVEFAEVIDRSPLRIRLRIIFKILFKKL